MRKSMRIMLLILTAVLALTPCALAEFAAQVKTNRMPVYSDEAMTSQLGTLPRSTVVVVGSYANGVARITYKGQSGYAPVSGMKAVSGEGQAATMSATARVYKSASTRAKFQTLSEGTAITLLATSGSWAMIEKNGYIGYTPSKNVHTGAAVVVAEPVEEKPDSGVVYSTFQAVVTADSLPVYASASSGAARLGTLRKGTPVTVVAYDDSWACLRNGAQYGFALRLGLGAPGAAEAVEETPVTPVVTPTPTPEPKQSESFEQAVQSGKYSNEQLIYMFLTQRMNLNSAAACGILSNIYSESGFRPTVYNPNGGSYGICQWTAGRYTKLKNWCGEHGYDYTTLTGQLYYLDYELKNEYPKVLSYMREVENTADGAYDAGYYWCYYYEVPASRSSGSVKRGNAAKTTYWPKYN